jgi:hypothetical protein
VAAATLAGVAAAFVSVHDGLAASRPTDNAAPVTSAGSNLTSNQATSAVTSKQMATTVHPDGEALVSRALRGAAQHRRQVAHAAAVRAAQRQAAQRQAAQQQAQAQPQQAASPPQSSAPPVTGGGDAAHSALGNCIRNAEEGGSYAWGPGNGGGAYQFQLGTWETYGGAASEYGVAGAAYQDQIFDNAIAAGGASNWTLYDGC